MKVTIENHNGRLRLRWNDGKRRTLALGLPDSPPQARILGVTATPIRLDGTGFRELFDELVCRVSVSELIDGGHLSRYKLLADPNPMITKGARKQQGDFNMADVA